MKFSYTLLKKILTKLPDKAKFIEQFNLRAFETTDLPAGRQAPGGDTIEISIPANRYSDAASHWGIAKLASAIFGQQIPKSNLPSALIGGGGQISKKLKIDLKKTAPAVKILAKNRCPRYIARYFEIPKMPYSPQWLKDALVSCGLRPINAVVDVMNYVMLEIGQPVHAFDFDKIERANSHAIEIRLAKKGEAIVAIDGAEYRLAPEDLVIADAKGPLAIAGVRGGKRAEVASATRKILVESANFDSVGIYKTSRALKLATDASVRFSHGLKPVLAEIAANRASELLKEICKAKVGEQAEVDYVKPRKTVLKFDIYEFNKLTGLDLKEKTALDYLKKLGFGVKGKTVEVPETRADIEQHEDLAEEIVNLYGYDKLPDAAPVVPLLPVQKENSVLIKEEARNILLGLGLSEVYNYSFVSRKDLTKHANPKWWGAAPLLNPISADFQYLRPNLVLRLLQNVEDNLRYYDSVRIFEIGKVFKDEEKRLKEQLHLGIVLAEKKGETAILELKGLADQLLRAIGLTDFFFPEETGDLKYFAKGGALRIESDHHVLGNIGIIKGAPQTAYCWLNLDELVPLIEGEKEYRPLSKYPAVVRDLSVGVPADTRTVEVQNVVENASQLLDDVDLIDWLDDARIVGAGRKSLTFRLRFQAEDRTLTDEEVGREIGRVIAALQEKFDAEIR